MNPTVPILVPYRAVHREAVIGLWNRVFSEMPNHQPFDAAGWLARIEEFSAPGGGGGLAGAGPTCFDPRLFRLAVLEDRVIGFVHGGTWEDTFLARLLPAGAAARLGTLLVIAVDPDHRRAGIGRALLRDLESTLHDTHGVEPPLRPDGRCFNPFYGNFVAPLPPPWGTAEGIAVPAGAEGTRAFFRAVGFREDEEAVTRVRSLADRPRFGGSFPEGVVVEEIEDYQPILGSDDGAAFPIANASRTWVLRERDEQLAALVAYPIREDGTHWGIHSFEVTPLRRGAGLGGSLLEYVLSSLAARGAERLEALAVPREAPEADRLYDRHGFVVAHRWVVVG